MLTNQEVTKYDGQTIMVLKLKDGNGSVGGYMVKKMIEAQERQMAGK